MDSLTVSFDFSEDDNSKCEDEAQQHNNYHHCQFDSDSSSNELSQDQLVCLLKTESSYSLACGGPCKRLPYLTSNDQEDYMPLEDWRRKICQWSFRVIDHFQLDREVVTVGMNLFDRFLILHNSHKRSIETSCFDCFCPSCRNSIDSRSYQLAAMACLYTAIKLHRDACTVNQDSSSSQRRTFQLCKFVDLSRGQFSEQDIVQMEQLVLTTLEWRVSPPTPMTFVNYLLTLLPGAAINHRSHPGLVLHVLRELSRYLTELAVCLGSDVTSCPPSQVAFASILVSMDLLTFGALPLSVRRSYCQAVYAKCQWQNCHTTIDFLRTKLMESLWPEMIFDDGLQSDVGHPITLARDFGLLDVGHLCRVQNSPPSSPKTNANTGSWEESPVSTLR